MAASGPFGRAAARVQNWWDPFFRAVIQQAYSMFRAAGLHEVCGTFGFTARSAPDSLINWISGGPDPIVNGAVWSSDIGWTTDDVDQMVDLGIGPGGKFQQDSAHMAVFSTNPPELNNAVALGRTANSTSFIMPVTASGRSGARLNSSSTATAVNSSRMHGDIIANRRSPGAFRILSRGNLLISAEIESTGPSGAGSSHFALGIGSNTGHHPSVVAGWSIGGGLTDAQEQALSAIMGLLGARFAPMP